MQLHYYTERLASVWMQVFVYNGSFYLLLYFFLSIHGSFWLTFVYRMHFVVCLQLLVVKPRNLIDQTENVNNFILHFGMIVVIIYTGSEVILCTLHISWSSMSQRLINDAPYLWRVITCLLLVLKSCHCVIFAFVVHETSLHCTATYCGVLSILTYIIYLSTLYVLMHAIIIKHIPRMMHRIWSLSLFIMVS